MRGRVMLGEIVSEIVSPSFPMNDELALCDSVPDPIEAHVNCFGTLLFDGGIGDACSACVVCLD